VIAPRDGVTDVGGAAGAVVAVERREVTGRVAAVAAAVILVVALLARLGDSVPAVSAVGAATVAPCRRRIGAWRVAAFARVDTRVAASRAVVAAAVVGIGIDIVAGLGRRIDRAVAAERAAAAARVLVRRLWNARRVARLGEVDPPVAAENVQDIDADAAVAGRMLAAAEVYGFFALFFGLQDRVATEGTVASAR